MNFTFLLSLTLGGLLVSSSVHAYIDPGTTGTVGGALAAIFPAIVVFVGFLIRPIKKGILFLFRKGKKKNKERDNA